MVLVLLVAIPAPQGLLRPPLSLSAPLSLISIPHPSITHHRLTSQDVAAIIAVDVTNRSSLADDCDSSTWNTLLAGVALVLHGLLLQLWWRELYRERPPAEREEEREGRAEIRVRGQVSPACLSLLAVIQSGILPQCSSYLSRPIPMLPLFPFLNPSFLHPSMRDRTTLAHPPTQQATHTAAMLTRFLLYIRWSVALCVCTLPDVCASAGDCHASLCYAGTVPVI